MTKVLPRILLNLTLHENNIYCLKDIITSKSLHFAQRHHPLNIICEHIEA